MYSSDPEHLVPCTIIEQRRTKILFALPVKVSVVMPWFGLVELTDLVLNISDPRDMKNRSISVQK